MNTFCLTRCCLLLGCALFSGCATAPAEPGSGSVESWSWQVPSSSWLDLAKQAEARLQWQEAGIWLDRYARLPEAQLDEEFWFHRAAVAEQAGDLYRSAEVREQLLAKHPEDVWLRIDLADDYQQLGRGGEAVQLLQVAVAYDDDRQHLGLALVTLLEQQERWYDAAEQAERLAMESRESVARQWWERASAFYEKGGDLTRATICMERALKGWDLGAEEKRVLERLRAFELGEPENVADALLLLRNHPDPEMRLKGIRYLARDRFPNDVGVMEFALRDQDPRILVIALEQIAQRSERGRQAAVLPLLQHDDERVVLRALRALRQVGTETALGAVITAMDPDNRAQFRAARDAAEAISGHAIGLGLDPSLEERRQIKKAWVDWFAVQGEDKLGG